MNKLDDVARGTVLMGRAPDQLGFVVDDLEEAVRSAIAQMGMQPWSWFEYAEGVLPVRRYRGTEGDFTFRSASWGRGRYSMVEPVSGRSAFRSRLDASGPGLHHVGYFVSSIHESSRPIRELGGTEVMYAAGHGIDGDGELAFYDMGSPTGVLMELVRPPLRKRSADRVLDAARG